jgi:hypothetical protein
MRIGEALAVRWEDVDLKELIGRLLGEKSQPQKAENPDALICVYNSAPWAV